MKTTMTLLVAVSALVALGCANGSGGGRGMGDPRVEANLEMFDDLDYNVFSNQRWAEFHRSHTDDVVVHWPDGHTTTGLDTHIKDLQAMFVYAPDTRITVHPVKIGQGEWTAVIGVMEGTFTRPMPMPDGTVIQPTGKAFKLNMATFCHWTKEGRMDQEFLFWDNAEFMKQLGLGQAEPRS